ncbi:response regulator [Pseudoduganella namucuonensis]|uniref:Response regulator receiver domain-containing protein n=1 Tax=Pseudoduganella namucuonensis TaxID=1035707 RepID=A0A1I7FM41_9BURK|nr:response regulator [Pseudoduganella namucuonensis]SFU37267.1 Response regulator receiver domain-containing protein [Pseudoduganella namucuonensis]
MAARVLIIEDNQANMDLMSYLLDAFGHQPLCAYDGVHGLEMARGELPDLVICDIHLPRLDGYGVVRALKADPATRAIPVLAASALPVDDGGAALRAAGFDGHLPKSLEPDTLMPSVEAFLPAALRATHQPSAHNEAGAAPASAPARARVLLLDGAPANCGLVASIAAHLGYAPTVVADAAQADACAGQPFDLLLCDLDTTRGAADPAFAALLADVLRRRPALPVVLIRSAADDQVALALPDSPGGRPPLPLAHPLEPRELADALARCLART